MGEGVAKSHYHKKSEYMILQELPRCFAARLNRQAELEGRHSQTEFGNEKYFLDKLILRYSLDETPVLQFQLN